MAFLIPADAEPARCIRFVFADHLSHDLSALRDVDAQRDLILMVEVADEARSVPHHPQKIAFLFSSMRHFALALVARGLRVHYVTLDDPDNSGSFRGEIERAVQTRAVTDVVLTHPGEYRVLADCDSWQLGAASLTILPDDRFFCAPEQFADWAHGKKQLRLEFFYREMRKRTGYLMAASGEPEGGKWNYDADNRKKIPETVFSPPPLRFEVDAITGEVLALVGRAFSKHFGDLDGFNYAVTRQEALRALAHFVVHCLPSFGDYQDAMRRSKKPGDRTLWHSLLSPYLNVGLLNPQEVCEAALGAYSAGCIPLNAAEGFIRQIVGWREYVRGIYWLLMPDYAEGNFLEASRALPSFYWTGKTKMTCLAEAVEQTRELAYAHHIQRLMVTGNFALLYGVRPQDINAWYLAVYVDAFEWVQLPNTHGMVMHADGGVVGSKPYAASGKYIDRQSDYCAGCAYSVKTTTEPDSCPFNALYWNFIDGHRRQLGKNPRMGMIYRSWEKMDEAKRVATLTKAEQTIAAIEERRDP